jgi:hypothetical protein
MIANPHHHYSLAADSESSELNYLEYHALQNIITYSNANQHVTALVNVWNN